MGVIGNEISRNEFKSAYLIYGSEAYLRNYYKNALTTRLVNEGDNLNYSYFEGSKTNMMEVVDLLQTMPFLAEHRVVVVENSGWFAKGGDSDDSDKKSSSDKFSDLIDVIKNLSEEMIIIFSEEKVDKRSKLYKAVLNKGTCEEYVEQTDEQLARWLKNMAGSYGRKMDDRTAFYLVSECGNNMMLLKNELDKLIDWTLERGVITVNDVDEVCTHQVNNKIFDMISFIAVKKQKEALKLYYDLLTLRESPFHILTLMARQYTQMLAIKDASLKGEPASVVASKLSIQDWLAKRILDQTRNMNIRDIEANLRACAKADEDIKSGNLSDNMSVELLIVTCSSR